MGSCIALMTVSLDTPCYYTPNNAIFTYSWSRPLKHLISIPFQKVIEEPCCMTRLSKGFFTNLKRPTLIFQITWGNLGYKIRQKNQTRISWIFFNPVKLPWKQMISFGLLIAIYRPTSIHVLWAVQTKGKFMQNVYKETYEESLYSKNKRTD